MITTKICVKTIVLIATASLTSSIFSPPLSAFDEVYNFPLAPGTPTVGLLQASDGNFYGTTYSGGASDTGTVFRVSQSGDWTNLFSFNGQNGSHPEAELVQGNDGNLYGSTFHGGAYNNGTLFKISTNGTLTTLISFNGTNGRNPSAQMLQGGDGDFYGITASGGISDQGTLFRVTPEGELNTIFSFSGTNGSTPKGLTLGRDGNLYGTTYTGGTTNKGTVFKITPGGLITTLFSFTGGANGHYPAGPLVEGSDGVFYGTTYGTSSVNDNGTVYKITSEGIITTLAKFLFTAGKNPTGRLVLGTDGNLYGTARQGGRIDNTAGTVFKCTPSGSLNSIFSFTSSPNSIIQAADGYFYGTIRSDPGAIFRISSAGALTYIGQFYNKHGSAPLAPLVEREKNLYGTTQTGGDFGKGTVFKITADGTLTTLASFNGTNGSSPHINALISSSDGLFYGTTYSGGVNDTGTIFKMTTNGVVTRLTTFGSTNGIGPGSLVQGTDGNFYGTTSSGGEFGYGIAFKMTADGTRTTLVSFNGTNGKVPTRLLQGQDGNFYGITSDMGGNSGAPYYFSSRGTVFRMTPAGEVTTLAQFFHRDDAVYPRSLMQARDGNFYGTTAYPQYNEGAVFKMSPTGELTILRLIDPPFGNLVEGADGIFYGLMRNRNSGVLTVFRITSTGVFTRLLNVGTSPTYPSGGLTLTGDGNIYGTVSSGGSMKVGVAFRLFTPIRTSQSNGQITISWSTNASGAVLQTSTNLGSQIVWNDCTNQPQVINGMFSVSDPVTQASQIYQLKQ